MRFRVGALAISALVACSGRSPYVVLTIEDPLALAVGFARIELGPAPGELHRVRLSSHALPLRVTVTAASPGLRRLWVEARRGDGTPLGRGLVEADFRRRGAPSATVVLYPPCAADAECAHGRDCGDVEQCDTGMCRSTGAPLPLDDDNPCTLDRCVVGEGVVHQPDLERNGLSCGLDVFPAPVAICLDGVCTAAACADGYVTTLALETCDDGDEEPGDGCSASCTLEPGWYCSGAPSQCRTHCGDAVTAGDEQCDDGNISSCDACLADCTPFDGAHGCGDGFKCESEQCDTGTAALSDEPCAGCCRTDCTPQRCGDGVTDVAAGETCDSGAPNAFCQSCSTVPGPFLEASGTSVSRAAVLIDDTGRVTTLWYGSAGINSHVFSRRHGAAEPWVYEDLVVDTIGQAAVVVFGPVAAGNESGALAVAWTQIDVFEGYTVSLIRRYGAGREARLPLAAAGPGGGATAIALALDRDERLLAVWSELAVTEPADIIASRWNAAGEVLSDQVVVNTTTAGDQHSPRVAARPAGAAWVVWVSDGQDGDQGGIFAQRFADDGTAVGGELPVNVTTAGAQLGPDVCVDSAGGAVVTWVQTTPDPEVSEVVARRFDAAGAAVTGEVVVAGVDGTTATRVACDATGAFFVLWLVPTLSDLALQRFSPAGAPLAGPAHPVSCPPDDPIRGKESFALAAEASGRAAMAWGDLETDCRGVWAQRFDRSGLAIGMEPF